MSLEHAILGFLNYRPYTGYDLKKMFDASVRHFWPADQSQIYRSLNKLTEDGLADYERVRQEKRPDRKEYHITDAGREELAAWLKTPLPFEENRSAPMIQVFFAGQLSDEEAVEMFTRVRDHLEMGLQAYESIPQQIEAYSDCTDSPREFYFWMLTLDAGRAIAEANIAWLDSVIERIQGGEAPQE